MFRFFQMTTKIQTKLFFIVYRNELVPIENRWKWGDVNDPLGLGGTVYTHEMVSSIIIWYRFSCGYLFAGALWADRGRCFYLRLLLLSAAFHTSGKVLSVSSMMGTVLYHAEEGIKNAKALTFSALLFFVSKSLAL
jgi:hypothetical protein